MNLCQLLCGLAVGVGALTSGTDVQAGDWRIKGFAATEVRAYTQDAKWAGQSDNTEISVILNPEFRYKSEDRKHRINFIPFVRGTNTDGERSHGDIREAYYMYIDDKFDVLIGANKVFWGVTESQHLVNIINQVDLVEDPDQEDYLGQPMLQIATQQDWGRVTAYVMPYFRERNFAGVEGRLRARLPYDTHKATYESGAEEWHPDFALRYSHYMGDFDIGLSYFHGTGREPTFNVTPEGKLRPHYSLINQAGLDLQYTTDAWLWKLESIIREGHGKTFAAAVGGFEYSFYQIFKSDMDLGILLEYQYDGRDDDAPITIANNDIFAGARLAFNDIQDTEILAGMTFDHENQDSFINIEAERRFGDNFSAEIRARFITGADEGEDLYEFARDDYIQLRLSRYF